MPLYHFDLVSMKTNVDVGDAELPDDIEAMDCADMIARKYLDVRPDVKNHEFSILVTNEEGEEIFRLPIDTEGTTECDIPTTAWSRTRWRRTSQPTRRGPRPLTRPIPTNQLRVRQRATPSSTMTRRPRVPE
jgi:hypothetical protein